VSHLEFQSKI